MTVLLALYRFFLRRHLTWGRAALFGFLGTIALIAAVAIARAAPEPDQIQASVRFTWGFGLGLMVPVISLVLAGSSLGELIDDETLVYLWHRPSPRWKLALSAWAAALSIALPFTVVPLAAAAAIASSLDIGVVAAVAVAVSLAAVAYTAVFVLAGLVFRKALIWGLMYLFIWELFVSKAGVGAARLSIGTYPASLLSELTGIDLPMAQRHPLATFVVPVVVAGVGLAMTSWRLDHIEVA
jgi:ABC-2 type transport system permease protein